MKKIFVALVAFAALCACSSEKKDFQYRGLSMFMPFPAFVDSLQQRGFAIDSAKTDSTPFIRIEMFNPDEKYRLVIAQLHDTLLAVQEHYRFSTNDSTRNLWQKIRDEKEKELGVWPNCPMLKDDHKIAKFDTGEGFITVTLENTYRPSLSVLYDVKRGNNK